jgi:leucyl aminopeptidase
MKFIQEKDIKLQRAHEYILVPFFEETNIKSQLEQINLNSNYIEAVLQRQKKLEQYSILLPTETGSIAITLMNLGFEANYDLNHLIELFRCFGKKVEDDYQILLHGLQFRNHSTQQITETIIKAMYIGAYSFAKEALNEVSTSRLFSMREQLKSEKSARTFTLIYSEDLQDSIDKAMNYGRCINFARVLGDIPNNYLHVKQFTDYLKDFSKEYHLSCDILGKKELENLHSGGILGVNAGSSEEANLITIYYEGSKGAPVTALIGKGVMFDSGGYHIKSIGGMEGMKYDMCGAANMLSVLEIAVRQKSEKNILLVIPAVENVISPDACKMGDVLTTMSGKTVEVYNTDAEGRLILCDAITYAIKKGASSMIDLATLTYSCQRALGNKISGIYSNNDGFYEAFAKKTREQCEKVWRLPLDSVYHELLYRSQTADLINYAPGSDGGASVAACFLEEFVEKDIPWIHLDIVGTAVERSESQMQTIGATGVLIASIAAFLEE